MYGTYVVSVTLTSLRTRPQAGYVILIGYNLIQKHLLGSLL